MMQPPLEQDETTAAEPNLIGRRVGCYQLEHELGRGGMGSVWLARRDDGYYEAKVAIKLLVISWFGGEGAARFRHEGKLLARLDHPNIARLLDAGITDLGEPYLVLEYIEGQRIDVYCANARLGLRQRIELFLELLSAVAHAHRNLIVHRDIKPANVLVTPTGQAKLLDFGIGKLVEGQDELTSTGQRILTPQFAAPEQLLGDPVTTATDIYTLGLLLYILLTGRLPHSGSPAELIRRITLGEMPPPSSVEISHSRLGAEVLAAPIPPEIMHDLQRQLRGDIDNIVLKALQASPQQRYEDVGAFAADLRRYLNQEPVSARPCTLTYRAARFMQRNRTGVVATILMLVAIIVGTITTVSQTIEARRQRAEAEYQGRSMQLIADFLNLTLFSEGGPDRPALSMLERLERGAKLVEAQYPNDPSFAGRMLLQMVGPMAAAGDTGPYLKLMARAYELGEKAGDQDLMAQSQCGSSVVLIQSGTVKGVRERVQEGLRLLATADRVEFETRAICLVAQAKLEQSAANPKQAEVFVKQAMALLEHEGATFRPIYTVVLSILNGVYMDQSKLAAAIAVTQKQARMEQQFGRGDTSEHLSTRQNAATLLMMVGEVRQSMADREKITPLMRRFTAELPLIYVINQALLLTRLARAPEAAKLLAAVMDRAREANNPRALVHLMHCQAWAAIETRDLSLADSALHEVQAALDQGVGGVGLRSQLELRRAQLALLRQDPAAARRHADQALVHAGYQTDKPQRSLATMLIGAAKIALATGHAADAERFATEGLRLTESIARTPDSSADVGESLLLVVKSTPHSAPAQRRTLLQRAVRCLGNGLGADHPLTAEARTLLASLGV
jgi:serine/threonine-protein kinase